MNLLSEMKFASNKLNSIIFKSALLLGIILMLLFTWSILSPLDSAIIAQGFVKGENNHRKIQHYDGGIIESILVTEGQHVKQGELLIRLNDEELKNQITAKKNEYLHLLLRLKRLDSLKQGLTKIPYNSELTRLAENLGMSYLLAKNQELLDQDIVVLEQKSALIISKIKQNSSELNRSQTELSSLGQQRLLLNKEMSALNALIKHNYITEQKLIDIQREELQLISLINSTESNLIQSQEAKHELQLSLRHLKSLHIQKHQQDKEYNDARIPNLKKDLYLLQEKLQRMNILAPSSGHVTQLQKHTNGGTIRSNEILMEIVPDDTKMMIEAHINPDDIESIRQGLATKVRITAFNARRAAPLDATIVQTSADRLTSPQGTHYYAVALEIDKHREKLYPGMPAEIIIPIAKRSLFDYLFDSMLNSSNLAMREI